MRVIYLPGVAGYPKLSPALEGLDAEFVVPDVPGLNGEAGFQSPPDYLSWLVTVWDALDATGALPCPVIGASVGGLLAADLAIFRPEAVTKLVLISPLGAFDERWPGEDLFATEGPERLELLFAGPVPTAFEEQFAGRGKDEAPVAEYLMTTAVASLLWPLLDRDLASRVHRISAPSLLVWGDRDRINPVERAVHYPGEAIVVPGAGHLVEWDQPDAVRDVVGPFLR